MSNYHFDFQKFSIIQEHSAMKVGTDGVLLGAWANLPNLPFSESFHPRILDVGTGTGVIALMLAQRFPEALIDAIEIDHEAAKEAKLNAKNSPWKDRIKVIETSLEDFIPETKSYDLIVTNPPFYNATLKPEDEARAAARHYDSLPFSDITEFSDKYLNDNGILAVIYPTNCEDNIMLGVASSSLRFHTICDVLTKEGKVCKRRMIMLSKKTENVVQKQALCLRNKADEFTQEYRNLTKDFYISLK